MKETELKLYPCYCGGEMEIKKVAQNGGMDGTYYNWELTCKKCGLAMACAADGFYGREYKTFEEVVSDWNRNREKREKFYKALDNEKVLYKIRDEIENHCGLIKEDHCKYCSYCNSVMGVREVLGIIDKYRTESEVQDADSN